MTAPPRRKTAFLTLLLALAALPVLPPAAAQTSPLSCQTAGDDFGNACASISFAWLDISGSAVELNAGDDVTTLVDLPFAVSHYGVAHTQAVVSTNGFLSFDADARAACCSPQLFPDASTPNDLVSFWWNDIVVAPGGLRMATLGEAPGRVVVIEYADAHYYGEADLLSFQVQLHESGAIEVHYAAAPNPTGRMIGVGIEDCNGAVGLPAAYGAIEAFGTALRFTPGNGTACVPAPVNQPPTVTIGSPAEGETVSGLLTITGTASDPEGEAFTTYAYLDSGLGYLPVNGTTVWSAELDTAAFDDGWHTITAFATDGEQGPGVLVSVYFQNGNAPNVPPQTVLTSPVDGSVVVGNVTIEGYANDSDGVVQAIDISIAGPAGGLAFQTTANPFSFDMGADFATGEYTVTAAAFDGEAWGEPAVSRFSYDADPSNAPPTLVVLAPSEGDVLPAQFRVAGNATDVDGDALTLRVCVEPAPMPCSVAFPDAAGTWAVDVDASMLPEGPYTLRVVADDGVEPTTALVNVYLESVANTPPDVAIESPAEGEIVGATFAVHGVASDAEQASGEVTVCLSDASSSVCTGGFASFAGDSWSVLLDATGLADGPYTLSAQAWDGIEWGPVATRGVFLATSLGARPVASILSPPDGAILSGMSAVELSAYDPDGEPVSEMEFCVLSAPIPGGCSVVPGGYLYESIDTTQIPDGSYVVSLRARDSVGYGDVVQSSFTVANGGGGNQGPVLAILSPADGATLDGVIEVSGTATDVDGFVGDVGLLVDGMLRGRSFVSGESWSFELDLGALPEGAHVVTVTGMDDGGLTGSDSITIVVERANTAPHVSIHYPTRGATARGVFETYGQAFDAEQDDLQVEVRIDGGAWLPAERGWSRLFDARALAPGLHDLEARAFDGELYSAVAFAQFVVEDAGALEVSFESPAPGAIVRGVATFAGTALDPDDGPSFAYVQVRVDQGPWLLATGTTTWTRDVDTTTLANGPHEAWARAWDGSGWVFGATTFEVANHADLAVSDEDVAVERGPVRTELGDAPLASSPERVVRVTVRNAGDVVSAPGATVRLYAEGELVAEATLRAIDAGGAETVKLAWSTLGWVGDVDLEVVVEPAADDADATNHVAHARDFVGVGGLGGARVGAL